MTPDNDDPTNRDAQTADDFADELRSSAELDNCLGCSTPTRSHVVLVAFLNDEPVPVSDEDDAEGFGTVCHTCFEAHDGSAKSVLTEYRDHLDRILAAVDADLSRLQVARKPAHVRDITFECGTCGHIVPISQVDDHLDEHDDDPDLAVVADPWGVTA